MAVFITGGYGHIGSWTAYLLAGQGDEVIILDTQSQPPDYLRTGWLNGYPGSGGKI
ncbi:MAG: hypothetical protein JRK26_24745 [Deltaproteobacteria bacterium]|nr:hypothetical protein [Deltaproteobacteria bacterium]